MTDEEALNATSELIIKILVECEKYAVKDGLDFKFVVKTMAKAMLNAIAEA